MRPSRRSRSLARAVTLAVVGAVAVGGASTAAFALDARTPAPTPSASASPSGPATSAAPVPRPAASRRPTTAVQGWREAASTVQAGRTYRALVLVSGTARTVRLERLVRGVWRTLDTDRTSRNGAAAVAWTAPRTAGRVDLRLHVLRAGTLPAVAPRKVLTVRATPAAASPRPTTTPPASARPVLTPSASARPVAVPTAAPRPATTAAAPAAAAEEAVRVQLLALVNRARATARTCGGTAYPAVPALRRSTALDTAAGEYALRMGRERFFAHTSPDGSTMMSRLQKVGVTNTTERENIAAGQTTAASVMASWLGSAGHCRNIMAADVTRIGLGHATVPGSPYSQYWVQDFAG